MKITPAQRKRFFAFYKTLGEDKTRALLKTVTRGITSLRDPGLTLGKMQMVLSELSKLEGNSTRQEVRRERPAHTGQVMEPITEDVLRAIERLKHKLKLKDAGYVAVCRHTINKVKPMTYKEGETVLRTLNRMITEKQKELFNLRKLFNQ